MKKSNTRNTAAEQRQHLISRVTAILVRTQVIKRQWFGYASGVMHPLDLSSDAFLSLLRS